MSTISNDSPMRTGWSVVDKQGKELCSLVPRSTADDMKWFYMQSNPAYGNGLEIKRSEPKPMPAPIVFSPDIYKPMAVPTPPKLPDIEAGRERAHLRECIERCKVTLTALEAAKVAAERAREHLAGCEAELTRLRAADVAETASAGAQLADRLKAGQAAPPEPKLRTGRAAVLDAEARRDAALGACELLGADVTAATKAMEQAAHDAQLAADVVMRSELQQRIEQLVALREQMVPLRQFIDDALRCGMPIDISAAREALVIPDLHWSGDQDMHVRLHNYREALRQDADVQFEDQPTEVKQ
ncbi:hypothetical protein [Burkholderia sp. NRF60-BP8]|uniref:hypothetical protein n=1 Tax=Burkholderia sp. NRF60-BP8 TaxID=1637853 RepID=UPI0007573845|nr:hypothetical protein [Burkholderia sp. NRF60-BP8]AOI78019.1 hypothetical protein WS54_16880 [Burkholderia sp. NRF60-BP8]KVA18048.1 hypothetical protein WS54_05555 [Burkholderia sp. NRF60-BP8]